MTVKTDSINDIRLRYRRPEIKVIPIAIQSVLCQSGIQSMYEKYYGDGGFEEQ